MKTLFETGATTHAVNDLILFADNTPELVKLRNDIYKTRGKTVTPESFIPLLDKTVKMYKNTFPYFMDHQHVVSSSEEWGVHCGRFTKDEQNEFCKLYVNDFENWKEENK